MTDTAKTSAASLLWIVLLTAASTLTTLALACATPFPSLAALAALHMHRRDGIALMLVAWAASQIVGFGLLNYPHDASTIGWGGALGVAAVASVLGARASVRRLAGKPFAARLTIAYVTAFVAFKLTILVFAFGLGGIWISIAPDIAARQFVRNGAILLFLLACYHALVGLGLPGAQPRRQVA